MTAGDLHTGFKSRRAGSSNEDLTQKISHSIFVTNFSDSVNSQDLWNKCRVWYGEWDVFNPGLIVKGSFNVENVQIILADEGFEEIKVYYLGGRWVMFECNKIEAKKNLMKHTGICSWFHVIQDVSQDFVSDERVVWVDIEGIPFHAWKQIVYDKLSILSSFLRRFKVMVKDTDSVRGVKIMNAEFSCSEYGLKRGGKENLLLCEVEETEVEKRDFESIFALTLRVYTHWLLREYQEEFLYNYQMVQTKARWVWFLSIGVLEEVIRVGQAMGYSMEGCEKDVGFIIGKQGDDVGFK
ncbi:hypothetical protein Tco_0270590 [Tanacetum coccineum]